MIRILIAEDSSTVAMHLRAIFEAEPDMEVVGHARDGREAVRLARELRPDLVTMDIRMPKMDGFEATRMIMATTPCPIVVVSSHLEDRELRITFRAIEEGALAAVEKPRGIGHPDFERDRDELVRTVRAMAEVKVVRRLFPRLPVAPSVFDAAIPQKTRAYRAVAIGCSTGGPQTLRLVLSGLPVGFPIPIVVVQHISRGFVGGLVTWLGGNTLLEVRLARHEEPLEAGTVYFAPDDRHLRVGGRPDDLVSALDEGPPVDGFRPSASVLFSSAAESTKGHAIGVLLTGMGGDGAAGLLELRRAGGHTIVQDEESAVVYGMPGAALALDAVDRVVRLDRMPEYLTSLARR